VLPKPSSKAVHFVRISHSNLAFCNIKWEILKRIYFTDLSFWYEYHELATRAAVFFSTSTLAGAFNGLLSYGISKNLDGVNGWRAWKWIFLIEGVLPIGFAFIVLAFLPASPSEIRRGFSETEKDELIKRSKRSHNSPEVRVQPKKVLELLLHIHFWLFAILYCTSLFTISSLSSFLPALIRVSSCRPTEARRRCLEELTIKRVSDTAQSELNCLLSSSMHVPVWGYYFSLELQTKQTLAGWQSHYPQLGVSRAMQC
jgi:MFS family permease